MTLIDGDRRAAKHRVRPIIAALIAAGLAMTAGITTSAASPATEDAIGKGKNTCVPGPKADCTGVVHKWTFKHHGNLSGAIFMRAQIHGADLRGANLRGADMRGVGLRHGDLRDANLRGANFGPVSKKEAEKALKRTGRNHQLRTMPSVDWGVGSFCNSESLSDVNCYNGMLSGADLSGADLTNANFSMAEIDNTNFTGANLTGATFINTEMSHVNFTNANLTGANLEGSAGQITWSNTTCPDGSITSTGCPLNDAYAYTKVATANS